MSYRTLAGAALLGLALAPWAAAAAGAAEAPAPDSDPAELPRHRDQIVVTAGPDPRTQDEIAQPTTVVEAADLQRKLQSTLGETLRLEPGINSTFFGPGASRPVIRGLGGDRIRILESGIGSGDASTTSPDHAVSSDPLSAERIEILRGPATLLYGSSATGGVINVIDSRIPRSVPEEPLAGTVDLRAGSSARERAGNLSLGGRLGAGGRFAWHLDGFDRESGNYSSARGEVANSATEAQGGSLGVSYVGSAGFLGVSASRFDTLYGSPAEEEVAIDLQQQRYDLQGELRRNFGFLSRLKLRFGQADYEHTELEGAEVGTLFLNDSWEGRLEGVQKPLGNLTGSVGVQRSRREFSALGEEAFVPPTQTDGWGVFTFQQLKAGSVEYQLGLRYEAQEVAAATQGLPRRRHDGLSGSLGLVWLPGDDYSLGFSLSRSLKLPNAEELFSNGPHLATDAFEIGDPNLGTEVNHGADLSLRKRSGIFTGEVSLFYNRFDGFIFEQPTGEEEDGLQVLRFTQRDAEFRGAELSGIFQLIPGFDAELGADFVRAELRGTGEPLPRIPPRRYRLGLHYRGDRLQGRVEAERSERQSRTSRFETATPGSTLLNASVGYRLLLGGGVYDLLLRGTNLTDELAFNHVSFLKGVAPLPGRDFNLSLKLSF